MYFRIFTYNPVLEFRPFMNKNSMMQLHTGNVMPVLGLGTWLLTHETKETVTYALKLGYRMIDTSSDYGTQPGIGKALKEHVIDRNSIFVVTKVEEDDDSYQRSRSNLQELDLDYVDLMLIHRPPIRGAGEDLWEGLIMAREEGLTRDIGVSNYNEDLIDMLIEGSGVVPVVNQIEWSPFGYSDEMVKYCKERNIIIQAYSPLTRSKRLNDKTLNHIAKKYGRSPAQILIRWNLQRGSVPIPKANQQRHLDENILVFDFEINERDMQLLNSLNEEYSSLGSLPFL